MLMNFPRFNKMKGMGQIVTWSIRDESLHCEGMIKLFHTFCAETGVMTDEARAFFEARILQGSQMLASIWLTAYRSAVPDTFLRSALIRRATAATASDAAAKGAP
jgi:hypothetical protein